jgi:hypothetical protein
MCATGIERECDSLHRDPSHTAHARNIPDLCRGGTHTGSASGTADVAGLAATRHSSSAPMYFVVPRLNLNVGAKDSGPSCQSLNARPAGRIRDSMKTQKSWSRWQIAFDYSHCRWGFDGGFCSLGSQVENKPASADARPG